MIVRLESWGNDLGIRLPKAVLDAAGFRSDDTLLAKAENGRIVLYPSAIHRTLEQRAAEYNGNLNLDGELDWRGGPMGNEVL